MHCGTTTAGMGTSDGRLTILEGPPGCGKTFLIRSLIHEVPNSRFVFVPPSLVASLGDPSMTSVLLELSNQNDEDAGPTVLICEDADAILTKRGGDNMHSTSAVLNFTDGITGDVVDIRIVATTNASRTDIEEALLRPGRLAHYLQVGPLSKEYATKRLQDILADDKATHDWPAAKVPGKKNKGTLGFDDTVDEELKDKVLLADVFKEAKNRGWKPVNKKSSKFSALRIKTRRPRRYADDKGQMVAQALAETGQD